MYADVVRERSKVVTAMSLDARTMQRLSLIECARQADILTVAQRFGALRRVGASEYAGPCPVCGGTDRFSVNSKKQLWNCRGCGKGGGDAISLAMHALDLDFRQAVAFLTGVDATSDSRRRGSQLPAGRVLSNAGLPIPAIAQSQPAALPGFVERQVAAIVAELNPVRTTPGEDNLRETRKIDTEAIADVLERIDAIGWHPSVLLREEGHPLDGKKLGCIVGVMSDPITAKPTGAISRTYIHEGWKVGKAKTLGSPVGVVRLSGDEDVLLGLHLAEGLETALAAMAKGFRPVWSTGSAGVMAAFAVLVGVEALTLFADNDLSGTGLRAANEAAARWRAAGRETHIYLRDALGDFNDVLLEASG